MRPPASVRGRRLLPDSPSEQVEKACLTNALRLETYIQDAEREGDSELADFFHRARPRAKGAEQGKQLPRARLGN